MGTLAVETKPVVLQTLHCTRQFCSCAYCINGFVIFLQYVPDTIILFIYFMKSFYGDEINRRGEVETPRDLE